MRNRNRRPSSRAWSEARAAPVHTRWRVGHIVVVRPDSSASDSSTGYGPGEVPLSIAVAIVRNSRRSWAEISDPREPVRIVNEPSVAARSFARFQRSNRGPDAPSVGL